MSKLGDSGSKVPVIDKTNYKPLSGLGPAMSPQEIALEKANAAAKNNTKYAPGKIIGDDAHIIHSIREAISTEAILPDNIQRSDDAKPPTKGKSTGRSI